MQIEWCWNDEKAALGTGTGGVYRRETGGVPSGSPASGSHAAGLGSYSGAVSQNRFRFADPSVNGDLVTVHALLNDTKSPAT
jgi:hypothetical protein